MEGWVVGCGRCCYAAAAVATVAVVEKVMAMLLQRFIQHASRDGIQATTGPAGTDYNGVAQNHGLQQLGAKPRTASP